MMPLVPCRLIRAESEPDQKPERTVVELERQRQECDGAHFWRLTFTHVNVVQLRYLRVLPQNARLPALSALPLPGAGLPRREVWMYDTNYTKSCCTHRVRILQC